MLRRRVAAVWMVLWLAGGPAGAPLALAQTPAAVEPASAADRTSNTDSAAASAESSADASESVTPVETPPHETARMPAPHREPDFAEKLTQGRMGRTIRRFTYLAIIGVLLLCGMGVPLPEELPIIISGVLSRMGHLSPWPALLAVLVGILGGDSIMFFLGRRWGTHVLEHRFARILLTHERQAKIAEYFHKYGPWIIFAARFLPGLRSPLYLTAGSMQVRWRTFLSMDGLAALLSIPLSFWLAYYFTEQLKEMLELSHFALYWGLGILAVGLIAGHLIWDRWRDHRRRQLDVVDPAHPDPVLDLIHETAEPAATAAEAPAGANHVP